RFDEIMRDVALRHYQVIESDLGPLLTRFAVEETVRRIRLAGDLHWPAGIDEEKQLDDWAHELGPEFGPWLAKNPAAEDVARLTRDVANRLKAVGAVDDPAAALSANRSLPRQLVRG